MLLGPLNLQGYRQAERILSVGHSTVASPPCRDSTPGPDPVLDSSKRLVTPPKPQRNYGRENRGQQSDHRYNAHLEGLDPRNHAHTQQCTGTATDRGLTVLEDAGRAITPGKRGEREGKRERERDTHIERSQFMEASALKSSTTNAYLDPWSRDSGHSSRGKLLAACLATNSQTPSTHRFTDVSRMR